MDKKPKLSLKQHQDLGCLIKMSFVELERKRHEISSTYGDLSFSTFLVDQVSRSLHSLREELDSLVRAENDRSGAEDIETIYYGEVKKQ